MDCVSNVHHLSLIIPTPPGLLTSAFDTTVATAKLLLQAWLVCIRQYVCFSESDLVVVKHVQTNVIAKQRAELL